MTNEEWLEHLAHNDIPGLRAWFKAEHPESSESGALVQCAQIDGEGRERAADGDTKPENADLRERLEADARKIADAYNMDSQRHGTERFTHELYYSIIHLLDRQAALTDAEWDDELEQLHMGYKPLIDGLQAQVDELTAERDNLAKDLAMANNERERYRRLLGKALDYADAIHALADEGLA